MLIIKTGLAIIAVFFTITVSGTSTKAQSFLEKSLVAKSRLHDPVWQQHDPSSTIKVDHGKWNAFLQTYVSTDQKGINRVNYSGVSVADKENLSSYLTGLQNVDVTQLNRGEQYAFWLNLYNASMVDIILENYPISSVLDIKSNPLDLKGPFNDKIARINGLDLTLDTIESGIVRPVWNDPRLHYAFNCGAVGCPNLMQEAYQGDILDKQLDAAAATFINDRRGINAKGNNVTLSKIFFWYSEDFGSDINSLNRHLRTYADPQTRAIIDEAKGRYKYAYDWALNDIR